VAAVALNKEGHPIKMRMTVVDGFKTSPLLIGQNGIFVVAR
jgi:hypothetical protein